MPTNRGTSIQVGLIAKEVLQTRKVMSVKKDHHKISQY